MSGDEYGHGAVARIKLKDFMQFTNIEFQPGPMLNVVIGPNGAGKSSLVNAIALGLGAETGVLGRADYTEEFIRTGCDGAEVEIELHNAVPNQDNYIFRRLIYK
jgi:chromosome segregation ATPase